VEHPVSEMVSGVDIIRQQILAASGEPLEVAQDQVRLEGYAVECRINARSAGRVTRCRLPGGFGVRVDTYLHDGAVVSPYYDHLVAKVIASGKNRAEGLARMGRALSELLIDGITTNAPQQSRIVAHPVFRRGIYGTGFIADMQKEGLP
jgi:acetyl-CoA carboxylase, biotin carboxylase subunit